MCEADGQYVIYIYMNIAKDRCVQSLAISHLDRRCANTMYIVKHCFNDCPYGYQSSNTANVVGSLSSDRWLECPEALEHG